MEENTVKFQILSQIDNISSRVDVMRITDYLMSDDKLIDNAAREQIRNKSSTSEQCRTLLFHLTRSPTVTPYLDFRDSLKVCGYLDVIETIDEDVPMVYQSIQLGKRGILCKIIKHLVVDVASKCI